MNKRQVWIVGKVNPDNYLEWEFQVVYDEEVMAVGVCRDRYYFVAPAVKNEELPEETVDWPQLYYPKAE